MSVATLAPVRHILHAIATTVVPETTSFDARAWAELDAVIDAAVVKRGDRVGRQLITFLRMLQLSATLRYGKPLASLDARRRTEFLTAIERSRLLLVRRGFWGVRTLIFMAYYTRSDVADEIGYHPSADGWAARGGTVTTVPLAPALWVEP